MKKPVKRILVSLLAMILLTTIVFAGCARTEKPYAETPGTEAAAAKEEKAAETPKEKVKVDFWYLWTAESEVNLIESLISEFNSSQNSVEVKGLSSDAQAITVAISGGSGPDVSDDFDNRLAAYADQGILEPLDEYISKSGFDTSDFIEAALNTCRYQGKTYALPINVTTFMLFYNKKLFSEAGLTEPPKTDKELLDYAIKLTKVNSDKTIEVLGYPDFPFVYFTVPMTYALGGEFMDASGKFTANNIGTITALNNLIEYRKRFGVENVLQFNSAAKYMDATDPFATGNQAMRIDGPWFGNHLKNVLKADIDYGVAPFPYPEGKPELAGGGNLQTSIFYISATSKKKDEAWSFLSWLMDKNGMLKFNAGMANLPARKSLLADPEITKIQDFEDFGKQAMSPNMKYFPADHRQAEFTTIMNAEVDLAVNLTKPLEDALKATDEQAAKLK